MKSVSSKVIPHRARNRHYVTGSAGSSASSIAASSSNSNPLTIIGESDNTTAPSDSNVYSALRMVSSGFDVGGIFNVSANVPLSSGYYDKTTARAAVPTAKRKKGLILSYEIANRVWFSERYCGPDTTTGNFTSNSYWMQINLPSVSVQPYRSGTKNVSLVGKTLTFAMAGATVAVDNVNHGIIGTVANKVFTISGSYTREYVYLDITKLGVTPDSAIDWDTVTDLFVVSHEAKLYGNYHLIASCYQSEWFIHDVSLADSLRNDYSNSKSIAIMSYLNNTKNITLEGNTLTFGIAGFSLVYGKLLHSITGTNPKIFNIASMGGTRGYVYLNLAEVSRFANASYNWDTTNIFTTSINNALEGQYFLVASYYGQEWFVNDASLSMSLLVSSIVEAGDIPYSCRTILNMGKLFSITTPIMPIRIDTVMATITIPSGYSVFAEKSNDRYDVAGDQVLPIYPTGTNGAQVASSFGILLFDIVNLTFKVHYWFHAQPADTIIVGVIRRSTSVLTSCGIVTTWGIENIRIDGRLQTDCPSRNEDMASLVQAMAAPKYGSIGRFTIVQGSDFHSNFSCMNSFVDYANSIGRVADLVINNGDLTDGYIEYDMSRINAIFSSTTPKYLPVVGNHDTANGKKLSQNGSNAEVLARVIAPHMTRAGVTTSAPYYYYDDTTHKIRVIVLNEFDNDTFDSHWWERVAYNASYQTYSETTVYTANSYVNVVNHTDYSYRAKLTVPIDIRPEYGAYFTRDSYNAAYPLYDDYQDYPTGTHVLKAGNTSDSFVASVDIYGGRIPAFKFNRGYRIFSQTQITWFINTLKNIPADYAVIVAQHQCPALTGNITKDTTYSSTTEYGYVMDYMDFNPIPVIVNAFRNKANLAGSQCAFNTAYQECAGMGYLTLDGDFRNVLSSEFICYLHGHHHADIVGTINAYPTQHSIGVTAGSYSNSDWDDLPRIPGTRTEDAFNVISVDRTEKKIYLARIGSNMSNSFVDRRKTTLTYI